MISIRKKRPYQKIALVAAVILTGTLGQTLYVKKQNTPVAPTQQTTTTNGNANATFVVDGKKTVAPTGGFQAEKGQKVEFTSDVVPVQTSANAAALAWMQSGSDGLNMEVRTKNGDTWSNWTKIEAEDPGKDGSLPATSTALVLAKNIDDIQYRVTLTAASDKPSASIDVSKSTITAIDSSRGPSESSSSLLGSIFPTASAVATTPQTITREQWGNPQPNSSDWTPEYAKLGRVILHHTATTESNDSYADVRAIWQYHTYTLGWGDIGYHYIIDSKGQIFEGRYYDKDYARKNRVEVIGGHAYGNNVGTIGISMIGNFTYQQPTTAALNSMARVTGYKLASVSIDPSGNGPYGEAVVGHYQVYATSCPGQNIINKFSYIKQMASADYNAYLPLFGFDPMAIPRWMRISKETQKINVDTGNVIDNVLTAGTDLKFVDKYERDGKWYLRTEHDYTANIRKGVPLDDLVNIAAEKLPSTKWLQLNSDRKRIDPTTEVIDNSTTYPAGLIIQFTDKIQVNGLWYYRAQSDYNAGAMLYFRKIALDEPKFTDFVTPRYMTITENTQKLNPFTGESGELVTAGTQQLLTSKITVADQTFYRTEKDSQDGVFIGIPAERTKNISYTPLEPPRVMALSQDTPKLSSLTLQPQGGVIKTTEFPQIAFSEQMSINGIIYYRTSHDTLGNIQLVLPSSALSEIPYEQMVAPRALTVNTNTSVYNPKTGLVIGSLSKGTRQFYDSKITVAGVTYLRSDTYTKSSADRAVRLDSF